MNLTKAFLMGSAAILGLAGMEGASAADLPSKKAAPVQYVRICSGYGDGFFMIPGTDTCLRVGGNVRYDTHYAPGKAIINPANGLVSQVAGNQDTFGNEVRGVMSVDGRTASPFGTVQTFVRWRLTVTDGIRATSGVGNFQTSYVPQIGKTGNTLERAYIRFGGLAVGLIDDEFSPVPSFLIMGNVMPGFTNGVKGATYTYVFGGGWSVTGALQSRYDFAYDGNTANAVAPSAVATANNSSYVNTPTTGLNAVAVIRNEGSWGMAQISGAIGNNSTSTAPNSANNLLLGAQTYGSWAIGATLNVKLPQIAQGDQIWAMATYGKGMLGEVTSNSASTLMTDSSNKRMFGGVQRLDSNLVPTTVTAAGGPLTYGQESAWMLFGLFQHWWTPSLRSNFAAQYVSLLPPTAIANGAGAGLNTQNGKATVWGVNANLVWSPIRQFDIGVEVEYGQMKNSIQNAPAAFVAAGSPGLKVDNWGSKVRLQRNF